MKRFAIVLVTVLIATAAPARVWCEASCLLPDEHAASATPHCPTHEPTDGAAISASALENCQIADPARPPSTSRSELKSGAATTAVPEPAPQRAAHQPDTHPRSTNTIHTRNTPLRI